MGRFGHPVARGCLITAAVMLGIPLLIVGVVGVKTWVPLEKAGESLAELDHALGDAAAYVPIPSGAIPPERMEVFLDLREVIFAACDEYGIVRKGFESVGAIEEKDPEDLEDVGGVALDLGGASLTITPFLARFFERRNEALLEASMGLEEYAYIYAVAYHDRLLAPEVRREIFSDGEALSPEASVMLFGCLERQGVAVTEDAGELITAESRRMAADPSRLIWQDGLPGAVSDSVGPYRERLDALFCAATAGLELERDPGRALWIAIE